MADEPMTPADFCARMQAIAEGRGDTEQIHIRADELLLEVLRALGYGDGVDLFEAMPRWYA